MKTKVTKILLVFSITLLSLPALMAQKGVEDGSKYGHGEDSIRALQNLSMYKQFYRQKSYNDAIKPWRIVFNEAPKISKNMYIHGVNMYKIFFKNSKSVEEREKFVDTIMMIYDQRMEYFNSKGYLTARKGVDLGNLSPKRAKEAYDLIHEAVDMMDKQTPGFALNEMMQAALKLYNDDVISEDEMVNNFALASDILDYQMKNASSTKKRERYETIMNNVELIFTKSGAATCESLIPLLTQRYEEKPKDLENLKKIVGLLRNFDCEESDIFEKSAENLYELEPSANSAYSLARVFLKKKNWDKTIKYYEEAIRRETDDITLARYNKELADILLVADRSPAKAVQHARQALKHNPEDGNPYLTIGRAYANAQNFGENKFEQNTKYWAAVDMFYKAKAVDSTIADKANKLIDTYSQYFPDKEEAFFYNVTEGSNYTVGGWINHTTKVRF